MLTEDFNGMFRITDWTQLVYYVMSRFFSRFIVCVKNSKLSQNLGPKFEEKNKTVKKKFTKLRRRKNFSYRLN